MSGSLRIVLGDQLSRDLSALDGLDPARDVVLMAEVADEATYVPHHKQKIAFILSAMRHFAAELRAEGITVDYVKLDDPQNTGSFTGEVKRTAARHKPARIVATEPGEWRVRQAMRGWADETGLTVDIREDTRFFASRRRFARWAEDRRSYRMEFFYREMRRETGILLTPDGEPEGGQWNYDAENRKPLPKGYTLPKRQRFAPDATTREVLDLVARRFPDNFGDLEPFSWAVTRADALVALEEFISHSLPRFGDYQDAMKQQAPFLHHGLIAPYLNIGLLGPREVCAAAEAEYREGRAPLNAVEGFIRQILGWREYVRGLYWHRMPDYAESNALDARRPLPWFYWSGETRMNCLSEVIGQTRQHAYSHHIQRLMVTGNFALLAGIDPKQVEEWYLAVYADAFEWVELPNTHGMALFADGGIMASKPYAASGAYIDRMSDFCGHCAYKVKQKSGHEACPFNYLYWAFLIRNEKALKGNPRLAMPYRTLAKWPVERLSAITREAESFLNSLDAS
ncbi:cryptochrome/photolyase family protein [Oceanibaculum sp.]|uniref:cryptochrome/photolyase family protein n=1 Tax=Oceanibaculum sp. TaxID=1903597 RepID=UPI00258670DB|nr:cryptochrome/photolyase family protein [Oceanibaculum sp.]MCH2394590.1 cryptochrome/photolyase family protein [Oceanibaculum sp.]